MTAAGKVHVLKDSRLENVKLHRKRLVEASRSSASGSREDPVNPHAADKYGYAWVWSNPSTNPTIQLKVSELGLCVSMRLSYGQGCTMGSCSSSPTATDATLHRCDGTDIYQLFSYDKTTKLLRIFELQSWD
jgi:hypothetical protein